MINVLLCSYNNYYNRIVKKLDTVTEYRAATTPLFIDLENINFNPADGVTTDLIVGKGTGAFLSWDQGGPDYCIVYEKVTTTSGGVEVVTETIKSRWFIIDEDRTRNGQYKISLRRDVLADNIQNLETAPIYVEKGIISDLDSPLLCNNEGLSVNQIKQDEILLEDATKCPWLVMYLKKGVLGGTSVGTSGKVDVDVPDNDAEVYLTLRTPIGQWNMYQYTSVDYKVAGDMSFLVFWERTNTVNDYRYTCKKDGSSISYITGAHYTSNLRYNAGNSSSFRTLLDAQYKNHYSNLVSALNTDFGFKSYDGIWQYNGKVIKDSTGKYYQVQVYENSYFPVPTMFLNTVDQPTLKALMNSYWNTATSQSVTGNDQAFGIKGKWTNYRMTITEIPSVSTQIDFSAYQGNGAIDCPLYDVICMPYGTVHFSNPGDLLYGLDTTEERSLRVMNSLARNLGSSYVLDLQILPYCPCQELIHADLTPVTIIPLDLNKQAVTGYKTGVGVTDVLLVPTKVNFSFDITKNITISDSSNVQDTFKKKYVNDCTMVRVCSPNYNGVFEMNLARNDMSIDYFNVDVTLKPQTPYIHINPNFKGLYFKDWDDARGLICGGDFSLGIMDDAWVQYEIQNKNYQNIFDRQIQNLDRNNAINRMEAGFQAAAGTVQGAATGATAGFMASGSPWGAAAGAVIGGGTALAGGIADVNNLDRRIREQRSFSIDNYNLALGNVKALPYGITRTSALTYNNKKIPFVEIYECTPEEKEAYYLKLEYDGMTVGKIDQLVNFKSDSGLSFFKGQLIRNTVLSVDNHILNEINNELMKGVYI